MHARTFELVVLDGLVGKSVDGPASAATDEFVRVRVLWWYAMMSVLDHSPLAEDGGALAVVQLGAHLGCGTSAVSSQHTQLPRVQY